MTLFIIIFFALLGLNGLIMLSSLLGSLRKESDKPLKSASTVIYPINLLSSELKKAV